MQRHLVFQTVALISASPFDFLHGWLAALGLQGRAGAKGESRWGGGGRGGGWEVKKRLLSDRSSDEFSTQHCERSNGNEDVF